MVVHFQLPLCQGIESGHAPSHMGLEVGSHAMVHLLTTVIVTRQSAVGGAGPTPVMANSRASVTTALGESEEARIPS